MMSPKSLIYRDTLSAELDDRNLPSVQRPWSVVCNVLLLILLFQVQSAADTLRLDQTSVGRFGVGHSITPNSASQNLLTWNVVNTGRDIEARLYDPDGNPLTLGRCGLPLKPHEEARNTIRDIGWTQLTSRYATDHASLDVTESLLTPVLWLRTNSSDLSLFQPPIQTRIEAVNGLQVQALALPLHGGIVVCDPVHGYDQAESGALIRPWFLALVRQGDYRFPIVCLMHHAPASIRSLPSGGLSVLWRGSSEGNDHTIGLLPLLGCRPATLKLTSGWEQRLPPVVERAVDRFATLFLHLPIRMKETYRLTPSDVQVVDTLDFLDLKDDWGWSTRTRGYALVPPAVVNARRYGYPVRFDCPVNDLDYPMFLSSLCVSLDTSRLTYSLPRPDIYRTITSPYVDPVLKSALPDTVTQTVRDYSDYVVRTYQIKPHIDNANSAIGEARSLASEYPCSRMMTTKARQTFDRWANWAATRLYARQVCYGYGEEAANNRKFLIDNYRIGGKDYIDAGWFGYDVMAMWARAHYAGHWEDVRRNWSLIRELFYGWNWSYSDYAVMYSPLYLDAANGGNPKGDTDNMAMLSAHYAWARMADHIGDRAMLRDALYMLARDRVGRFNRMTLYDYTKSCGFHTDVNFLTSDLWDGPNIAPSGRYIPPDAARLRTGTLVDYGNNAAGLWFLSGSFLEPVTADTVDLILEGDMKRHVVATEETINRRFPRWWASPGSGEMANYQIYLRGALLHEDPTLLRYYFDYADSFRQGVWTADAWHADAYVGIILSAFQGLEHRGEMKVRMRDGGIWRPVTSEVETNLIQGRSHRWFLTLWNTTKTLLKVQLHIPRLGLSARCTWSDAKRGRALVPSLQGTLSITLVPGSNVLVCSRQPRQPHGIQVQAPAQVVAVVGTIHDVPITLTNRTAVATRCRVRSRGFSIGGKVTSQVVLRPGQSLVLHGRCAMPAVCREPYRIDLSLEMVGQSEKRQINVLTLPSTVTLLSLEGSRVIRAPDLGTAHLIAHNRRELGVTLLLRWSLNGLRAGQKLLRLDAGKGSEWSVPLQAHTAKPGRCRLSVTVEGEGIESQSEGCNLILLPPRGTDPAAQPVVLYGFEQDTEGWTLPDWPDANKNEQGQITQPVCSISQATEGKQSLSALFYIASGRSSQGFVGVRPLSDWRPFRRVLVDVFLPMEAPEGLNAQFYMMGEGWHWHQGKQTVLLRPGHWTTVSADLAGSASAAYWACAEGDLQSGLANVLDFGLRFGNNEPNWAGYHGWISVDNFRAESK